MNDSYRLDLCLFVPPYIIALASIRIACAFMELDVTDWFERLNVNGAEVSCLALPLLSRALMTWRLRVG